MATVTVEIADDEILVALKRCEGYEDVHPKFITEDAIGDNWPEYRTIQLDDRSGSDSEMLDWIAGHVFEIREGFVDEPMEIRWINRNGENAFSTGADLREAAQKAMESDK